MDLSFIAPTIIILAATDVAIHLYFDFKKAKSQFAHSGHSETPIPEGALFIAGVATVLSFFLVFAIPVDWYLTNAQSIQGILLISTPPVILTWIGFIFLVLGICLHGWSRWVRHELATSWKMDKRHTLVTHGPYARIRHPSYASYMWSFIGLFLIIPSIFTIPLFLGVPGYYLIAKTEEVQLLRHFGEEYNQYREHTGMFYPKIW